MRRNYARVRQTLALAISHELLREDGDDSIDEAARTCDEVIVTERFSTGRPKEAYGVSWIGRWPKVNP